MIDVLVTDMMNFDDTLSSQSRFIEQALVTFFRDCKQRGKFIKKFL